MVGFLVFGGILFVIGVIVALTGLKNYRRRQRILATPTSPIAQDPGNGPVEVKGRIVPGEQGVLQTPFSGRHAVWCRVSVLEYRSSGRSGHWVTILREVDQREFFVDDGSGQMAKVIPVGAEVILDQQQIASSGTFNDAPPHLQAFLASRGHSTTSFLGFNKSMRYQEEVLAPGDPLYALGPSRRDAGPPVHDGYRMAPSSQLVLFPGPGEVHELILTNKTEEQLVANLKWGLLGGIIMAAIGGGLGFLGVVIAILDAVL
jgi:hypothetical protein